MKQIFAVLTCTLLVAVNSLGADEEEDRMRELEEVTIATNEVGKASTSELLQGFTRTAEYEKRKKRQQDLDAMQDQEKLKQKQHSSATLEENARAECERAQDEPPMVKKK